MQFEELIDLAKVYEDAIVAEKLSKNEAVALLGILQARILKRVIQDSVPAATPAVSPRPDAVTQSERRMPVEPPKKPKAVSYDEYDPAPPFDVEKVPERQGSPDQIIANANTACICNNCHRVVYIVNRNIPNNCKIADFVASFTPTDGMPALTKSMEVQNIEGNISTDCPVCNGNKTLYLVGKSTDSGSISV